MKYALHDKPRIAIIGAGIIGLSCAVEFAQRGARVVIFDKYRPGRGASWAAAGMLAPAFETVDYAHGALPLFSLCMESAELWPDWAARLEAASGMSSGYDPEATVAVSYSDTDDAFQKLHEALIGGEVAHQYLKQNEVMALESALSPEVMCGLRLPTDTQVDNRLTLEALISVCERSPEIEIRLGEADLRFDSSGISHEGFDATLICAGWQTSIVKALVDHEALKLVNVDPVLDEIDPYGGQMLSLRRADKSPRTTIRAGDVYIVPKRDRVIVGATVEPGVVRDTSDVGIIAELLKRAAQVCPDLVDHDGLETWAGVRPGTDTHAPIMGQSAADGLFVASGHYRNGILLAPLTAKMMVDLILDGEASDLARAFWPSNYIAPVV